MAGPPLVTVSPSGKSIALQDLPESAWRYLAGRAGAEDGSVTDVYAKVPWIYRAVNIRAQMISQAPMAILKGDTELWSTEDDNLPPKGYEWLGRAASAHRSHRAIPVSGWGRVPVEAAQPRAGARPAVPAAAQRSLRSSIEMQG
jgi:hypothetical protein